MTVPETLLVTGATGLVGANVCQLARECGSRVKGLVRSTQNLVELEALGVELVRGDICDRSSLLAAMKGVQGVIHAAGAVGGPSSMLTPEQFQSVNYAGVSRVLDCAELQSVRRTVCVSTTSCLGDAFTMTERSPFKEIRSTDSPYLKAKRAGLYDGLLRASLGQDITFIFPGAIYGPSPLIERAFAPTSFNTPLLGAINAELDSFPNFVLTWVYAEDVARACLRAYEVGEIGARYLTAGIEETALTVAEFCNRAGAMMGVTHRVHGTDLVGQVWKPLTVPAVDPSRTTKALGFAPTTLQDGLAKTLSWFRSIGKIRAPFRE